MSSHSIAQKVVFRQHSFLTNEIVLPEGISAKVQDLYAPRTGERIRVYAFDDKSVVTVNPHGQIEASPAGILATDVLRQGVLPLRAPLRQGAEPATAHTVVKPLEQTVEVVVDQRSVPMDLLVIEKSHLANLFERVLIICLPDAYEGIEGACLDASVIRMVCAMHGWNVDATRLLTLLPSAVPDINASSPLMAFERGTSRLRELLSYPVFEVAKELGLEDGVLEDALVKHFSPSARRARAASPTVTNLPADAPFAITSQAVPAWIPLENPEYRLIAIGDDSRAPTHVLLMAQVDYWEHGKALLADLFETRGWDAARTQFWTFEDDQRILAPAAAKLFAPLVVRRRGFVAVGKATYLEELALASGARVAALVQALGYSTT